MQSQTSSCAQQCPGKARLKTDRNIYMARPERIDVGHNHCNWPYIRVQSIHTTCLLQVRATEPPSSPCRLALQGVAGGPVQRCAYAAL